MLVSNTGVPRAPEVATQEPYDRMFGLSIKSNLVTLLLQVSGKIAQTGYFGNVWVRCAGLA